MPVLAVKEYLQTRGLSLQPDEVQVAYLTLQTVINVGKASIDRELLWYANNELTLAEHIEQNDTHELLLKKMFMALDSVFSRQAARSAVVYALIPAVAPYLVRLVQQGEVVEQLLPVNDAQSIEHLPSRCVQTGWLNIVDDVAHWLSHDDLKGEHHARNQSQMTLPICHPNGAVLGVLHIEHAQKNTFDDAAQAEWVALALALVDSLQALMHYAPQEEIDNK